jgi:D-xylose transport system permease protein
MSAATPAAPEAAPAGLGQRIRDNISAGNLGSWPVIIGLALIVLFFSFKANNFFTPGNFTNIITQMGGMTMLAFGVVFVLLIGEIDLSISYVSGIAGVVVAKLTLPEASFDLHGNRAIIAILIAIGVCSLIGVLQGSIVAYIGVPAFVVTLAGYEIWQGVIQKSIEDKGVIVIQENLVNDTANYFLSDRLGWIFASVATAIYAAATLGGMIAARRHGVAVRDPWLSVGKIAGVALLSFLTVGICSRDRGVPFVLLLIIAMLLFWTFVAKRTAFGRHVYAVGGNAEAARRAGINVARIRVMVFAIAGAMSGLGGIILAARLNSVDLNAGGGTLLIDAIAAAVIGGTSLFGGRGEMRDAVFGALVIATIANGLNTLNLTQGVIYMTTGAILLFAVTLDTVLRRRQAKAGR